MVCWSLSSITSSTLGIRTDTPSRHWPARSQGHTSSCSTTASSAIRTSYSHHDTSDMKHTVISVLLLLFAGTVAFGQHSSNAYRDLADSLYRHHHYQYAADYYEKALKKAGQP